MGVRGASHSVPVCTDPSFSICDCIISNHQSYISTPVRYWHKNVTQFSGDIIYLLYSMILLFGVHRIQCQCALTHHFRYAIASFRIIKLQRFVYMWSYSFAPVRLLVPMIRILKGTWGLPMLTYISSTFDAYTSFLLLIILAFYINMIGIQTLPNFEEFILYVPRVLYAKSSF